MPLDDNLYKVKIQTILDAFKAQFRNVLLFICICLSVIIVRIWLYKACIRLYLRDTNYIVKAPAGQQEHYNAKNKGL